MTRGECLSILGLREDADMAEIKRAYRKLAFALHPDLNPDELNAAKRFQRLNEAYVTLTKSESRKASLFFHKRESADNTDVRAREEAKRAYARARQGQATKASSAKTAAEQKEEVLKDILQDPFARRVFEDIYSHIRQDDKREPPTLRSKMEAAQQQAATARPQRQVPRKQHNPLPEVPTVVGSVAGKIKNWFRRQIDDEQVIRLPGSSLVPGARVRLEIQHGLSGESETVELTLPPEFAPGKAMRLKGMGKRVGKMRGDLYVRIMASD